MKRLLFKRRMDARLVILEAKLRLAEGALRDIDAATHAWTRERANEVLHQVQHRVARYFQEAAHG